MRLAKQAGRIYVAAIVLSLVLTVAGLYRWGSDESPWEETPEPQAVSLIPLERVGDEYSARTNEVSAEIAEEVEAAGAPAGLTSAVTPVPPVDTPPPPPPAEPALEPDAPAPAQAPGTPVFSPLSIPLPTVPPTPVPPPPPPGALNYGLADQLLLLINGARQNAGLPALSRHGSLMAAAEGYARFHFLNSDPYHLDHYLDGSPQDRAARYGFGGLTAEVLVVGSPDANQLFRYWMDSPPHHDILMSGAYLNIGIACYQGPVQSGGGAFETALCVGDLGS